ncbi:MAG: DUF2793 domain-containing protein [Pseudomonadota bacterium]
MDETQLLHLPYIAQAQAQKHVTHNEALRILDAVLQISVRDVDQSAPPANPQEGERHIVAAGASGAWAGAEDAVAAFQDGAWALYPPQAGWVAYQEDEGTLLVFDGSAWVRVVGGDAVNPVGLVGVNATADATNRLSVNAPASLFNHEGQGHQLKINKNAAGDTASLLYQSGFTGHAEMGLTGDDDFRIKVSADGTTFRDAVVIARSDGEVMLPHTVGLRSLFNLCQDAGRFAGSPEPQSIQAATFAAPAYLSGANGAQFAAGPRFIDDNTDYGGGAGLLDADVKALIDGWKAAGQRRHGVEFYLLDVSAGQGTQDPVVSGGQTYYRALDHVAGAVGEAMSVNFHVRVKSGAMLVRDAAANADVSSGRSYIDGTPMAADTVIATGDGWRQVSHVLRHATAMSPGYNRSLFGVHVTPGARFFVAAMAVTLGDLSLAPGRVYGIVPSLELWR